MGFGGTVSAMIQSLKSNASFLRRNKAFEAWNKDYSREGKPIHTKNISEEGLHLIKVKIRSSIRKRRRIKLLITLLMIPLLALLSIKMYIKIQESIRDSLLRNKQYIEKDERERIDSEQQAHEKQLLHLINSAYGRLKQEDYYNAKKYIYEAYCLDKNDYRVQFVYAKIYVQDCIVNGVGCKLASSLVDDLMKDNQNEYGVEELYEQLKEKDNR